MRKLALLVISLLVMWCRVTLGQADSAHQTTDRERVAETEPIGWGDGLAEDPVVGIGDGIAFCFGPDVGYTDDLGNTRGFALGAEVTLPYLVSFGKEAPRILVLGVGTSYLHNFAGEREMVGAFVELSSFLAGLELGYATEIDEDGIEHGIRTGLYLLFPSAGNIYLQAFGGGSTAHKLIPMPIRNSLLRVSIFLAKILIT